MSIHETITVYAIDKNNRQFRVAGYDKKIALEAVKDKTVKAIVHAVKLIAIDSNGNIIATSEDL